MGIVYCEADRTFTIQTKNTTYQMQVDRFGFLLHLYYGKKTDGSCMDYLLTYPVSYPMIAKRYYKGGNNGSDVSPAKTKKELDKLPIKEDPGIDDLQKDSLVKIIELCENNGIKLIFLEPPKYIRMYGDKNYSEKITMLVDFLKEEGALVIMGEDMGFDNTNPDYYYDLSHMSGEGMNVFTDKVIEVLKSN